MKTFLLTFVTMLFIGGVYCQDTLHDNVYKKVNQIRTESKLDSFLVEEALELSAAQHACWLALYNIRTDTNEILLPSNEIKISMVTTLDSVEDRIKNYTDRQFYNSEEYITYFYEKPNSKMIFDFIKSKVLSNKFRYQGFWIIKYEDKSEKPIWYLVYLISD